MEKHDPYCDRIIKNESEQNQGSVVRIYLHFSLFGAEAFELAVILVQLRGTDRFLSRLQQFDFGHFGKLPHFFLESEKKK